LCAALQVTGPDGKVCYYYNADPRTIYERLVSSQCVVETLLLANMCIQPASVLPHHDVMSINGLQHRADAESCTT
jgi:hypothetical protein